MSPTRVQSNVGLALSLDARAASSSRTGHPPAVCYKRVRELAGFIVVRKLICFFPGAACDFFRHLSVEEIFAY